VFPWLVAGVGSGVGSCVASSVGPWLGAEVGSLVGSKVGSRVGSWVLSLGALVGMAEGDAVGTAGQNPGVFFPPLSSSQQPHLWTAKWLARSLLVLTQSDLYSVTPSLVFARQTATLFSPDEEVPQMSGLEDAQPSSERGVSTGDAVGSKVGSRVGSWVLSLGALVGIGETGDVVGEEVGVERLGQYLGENFPPLS